MNGHPQKEAARGSLSYDNECDSHSHDDQRICASNRDGEINVGDDVLRLELGLAVEHRTTPCNCLSCIHQAGDRNSFRGSPKSVLNKAKSSHFHQMRKWLDLFVTWAAVDPAMIATG